MSVHHCNRPEEKKNCGSRCRLRGPDPKVRSKSAPLVLVAFGDTSHLNIAPTGRWRRCAALCGLTRRFTCGGGPRLRVELPEIQHHIMMISIQRVVGLEPLQGRVYAGRPTACVMREQHPCPFLRPLHPNADPPAVVRRARHCWQHLGHWRHGRHIVAQVHHSADDRSLFGARPRTSCSMYQQHREHRDAPGDESPLHRRAAGADKTRPGLEWEGHKAQLTAVAARRASNTRRSPT